MIFLKKNWFFLFCLFFFISCSTQKSEISFYAMNTFMTIQSYGKNSDKINLEAKKRIEYLDSILSTTNISSEIYKLNHNQNEFIEVSDETKNLIEFSTKISDKTDGALNIALYPIILEWGFTTQNYKIPSLQKISELLVFTDYKKIEINENFVKLPENMMIDLGSVGKGFAGDEAIKILRKNGIKSAILDLGGNIQTLGKKIDGSDWNIGIKNPLDEKSTLSVKVCDKAVITSGGYERHFFSDDGTEYIHIFNPKTGFPVDNDILSVTIISNSGTYADALSTSLFVMGKENALNFWQNTQDFKLILICKDGSTIIKEN